MLRVSQNQIGLFTFYRSQQKLEQQENKYDNVIKQKISIHQEVNNNIEESFVQNSDIALNERIQKSSLKNNMKKSNNMSRVKNKVSSIIPIIEQQQYKQNNEELLKWKFYQKKQENKYSIDKFSQEMRYKNLSNFKYSQLMYKWSDNKQQEQINHTRHNNILKNKNNDKINRKEIIMLNSKRKSNVFSKHSKQRSMKSQIYQQLQINSSNLYEKYNRQQYSINNSSFQPESFKLKSIQQNKKVQYIIGQAEILKQYNKDQTNEQIKLYIERSKDKQGKKLIVIKSYRSETQRTKDKDIKVALPFVYKNYNYDQYSSIQQVNLTNNTSKQWSSNKKYTQKSKKYKRILLNTNDQRDKFLSYNNNRSYSKIDMNSTKYDSQVLHWNQRKKQFLKKIASICHKKIQ